MAQIYFCWCTIAIIFILVTDFIGVDSLTTKQPSLEELDPGIVVIEQLVTPIVAIKKSSVLINCSVVSSKKYRPVFYQWKKDGVLLDGKRHRSRIEIYNNGSLHIHRVIHREKGNFRTDEGFYECLARNRVGTVIGRRVQLKIPRIAKEFEERPESQTVALNGIAYLACKIQAVPETFYVWQKDNEPLTHDHQRFRMYANSLLITDIQASDAGRYKCYAANKALLEVDESSSQLRWRITNEAVVNVTGENTVLPLKIWQKPPTNLTVKVNESVVIDCIVASLPLPQIKWTISGKKLPPGAVILTDGSLSLTKISVEMAGVYKCMAKVPGDSSYTVIGETDLSVETTVRTPPIIVNGPTSSAYKIARHSILRCDVIGYPKPKITWLKNGELVQPDGRHEVLEETDSFRIINSAESDSGYYQCLAENSEGWATALARLKFYQNDHAPDPPKKVFGEGISGTEIIVNWTLEDTNEERVGFSVHYREVLSDSSQSVQEMNVPVTRDSRSKRLIHLTPNTNYSIYVKTYNRFSASIDSTPIIVHTLDSVPLSFPSPTISSQGDGKVWLQWKPLSEKQRGGVIVSYHIYYGKAGEREVRIVNVSGSETNYILTGLEADIKYRFRMLAGTQKGFPKFTDSEWPWIYYKIRSNTYYRNSILPIINITVINSSIVHVTWQYNGPIEISEQIIFLRNLKQMKVANIINYQPTSRQITLSHLAQNSFHEFFLVVKSKSFTTGSISKIFQTSPIDSPPPLDITRPNFNIVASLLQSDQINLTWSNPDNLDNIAFYTVRCETIFVQNECERKNNIRYIRSNTNTAVLSNLQPYTWYNISVRAVREDLQGVTSAPTLVLTREDVPSPPEHVHARVVSPDEVLLEWSQPAYPNGVIKGHYISYSYNDISQDKWPQFYQEGKLNTTNVYNLTQPTYYFLIQACTLAGRGKPSQIIKVVMKQEKKGFLSDQHLGILGGASIGITCILITVCVIFIKHRQLQKRTMAAQAATSVPCPHGCIIPSTISPPGNQPLQQNHTCKSEELWSLLTPSDKSTVDSPCSSNDTQSTSTGATDLYCHVTSC